MPGGVVTTQCCGARVIHTSINGTKWYECAACGMVIAV